MTEANRVINGCMTEYDPSIKTEVDRWKPNEWVKVEQRTEMYTYRTGWLGVWDAFVAAVSRRGRRVELVPATLSFWVKSAKPVDFSITQTQLETKGKS